MPCAELRKYAVNSRSTKQPAMTPAYQSVTLPALMLTATANTTTSSGGLKNRTLPIEIPFSSRGAEQFPLPLLLGPDEPG